MAAHCLAVPVLLFETEVNRVEDIVVLGAGSGGDYLLDELQGRSKGVGHRVGGSRRGQVVNKVIGICDFKVERAAGLPGNIAYDEVRLARKGRRVSFEYQFNEFHDIRT